jgi:hypothetical protein
MGFRDGVEKNLHAVLTFSGALKLESAIFAHRQWVSSARFRHFLPNAGSAGALLPDRSFPSPLKKES